MDLAQIELDLDGRLGRLTIWQSFDTAQLLLDVKSKDVSMRVTKPEMVLEDTLNVKHGDDSILLERINFTKQEDEKAPDLSSLDAAELSSEERLIIQAHVNFLFSTMPDKEETTYEQIRPYINVCVEKQTNWLVYSKALLFRSRNEMQRTKRMERSMNQIQQLIDQFRDQETETSLKMNYLFATAYPMSWGVKVELSNAY